MNNMNFTIWLTHNCNMECVYCYEKNKDGIDMRFDTAKQICEYIKRILDEKEINTCVIHFHGGEPLLKNALISFFIEQFSLIRNKTFLYTITTNGTIIDADIISNLKKMYEVNVSFDGDDVHQNENRPMKDGSLSSKLLISNICEIIENRIDFNIRMTIAPKNIKRIENDIVYLAKLGVRNIICAIDYWNYRWLLKDLEAYKNMLRIVKEKYNGKICISSIYDNCKSIKGKCFGGINSNVIDCDGSIYPCTVVCGNYTFRIGNIIKGVQDDWQQKIGILNSLKNNKCNSCLEDSMCQARRCILLGYASENLLPNLCLIQQTSK